MASSRPWPFDDDDRPSGSVRPLSQADLQAILAHLGDDPDQLLVGTDINRPVVAVRVRATVGRPGGSAQARWRRLRSAEWAAWIRTLPWRVAVLLRIGASGGVLGSLAVPRSQASIDHLVIGPGGVFVIDSKQHRGRLQLEPSGGLWHGRYPLAPTLQAVSFEADQAAVVLPDPGMAVVPLVAVHGAQVPWGKIVVGGVPVVAARRLPSMLHALPAVLGPKRVTALADQARIRFRAAA